MFWRSVVAKLALTILLLVSLVLFILTILLLEFFENFHIQEAEKSLEQTANKVTDMINEKYDDDFILETIEYIKDPTSRVVIISSDENVFTSNTTNTDLSLLGDMWFKNDKKISKILAEDGNITTQMKPPNEEIEVILVGTRIKDHNSTVFVYQSLDVIDQTKAETTKIIFLAAGIAIILTTIFAFFLSTRITSPLIKMREAAFDLAKGEFNTKVPILTHDEIGELAIAFNRIGRQMNFQINALKQEKEQLSSIVNAMADGVVTMNRSGKMIVTNPPAEQFIDDWYFDNNIEKNGDRQLPNVLYQILQKVIQGEKEVLQETSLQGRNWVMIMTPLHDENHVRGAVAVIRDMTEERRLDKLRKDFISNVSHELRTPISLLQGYSEAIIDDIAESKEEKNELAQIINEESLRMGRLVNELLDLSRMEAGHIQLNLETIDVEDFVVRILNKFSLRALESNIRLSLVNEIEMDTGIFDPDRIEQVFTNLIGNALNHITDNDDIKVLVKNNASYLHVEINDTGKGIPEEDLPFIFERFYKADKSRTRNSKKKGTGLGLAIAKNIIDAHHGTISVRSKVDIGTTFSFKIPYIEK